MKIRTEISKIETRETIQKDKTMSSFFENVLKNWQTFSWTDKENRGLK